jgi:hypothetical protein
MTTKPLLLKALNEILLTEEEDKSNHKKYEKKINLTK